MAEVVDPARTLISAREKLIEERRGLAVAIALGYRRRRTDDPHANEVRASFIDVQNLIEAIEKAIRHETFIANEMSTSFVKPALETIPTIISNPVAQETG